MQEKERHGCVTAWIILMIFINALSSFAYLFARDLVRETMSDGSSYVAVFVLAAIGFLNIYYALMLFKWKKWAFWGFTITAFFTLVLNIYIGVELQQAILGITGIGLLWMILQIKKHGVSAWDNLE